MVFIYYLLCEVFVATLHILLPVVLLHFVAIFPFRQVVFHEENRFQVSPLPIQEAH